MINKLNQLFTDEVDYNKKMWRFLECCYSNGWILRATGRDLKIDHKTVKNILDSIKNEETYKIFMSKVEDTVQGFADDEFSKTVKQMFDMANMMRTSHTTAADAKRVTSPTVSSGSYDFDQIETVCDTGRNLVKALNKILDSIDSNIIQYKQKALAQVEEETYIQHI